VLAEVDFHLQMGLDLLDVIVEHRHRHDADQRRHRTHGRAEEGDSPKMLQLLALASGVLVHFLVAGHIVSLEFTFDRMAI
jgi:hypothetical protein